MIKRFDFNGKINFVDHLNTVVGFDYTQNCCEEFEYYFETLDGQRIELSDKQLCAFTFNTNDASVIVNEGLKSGDYIYTNTVKFLMTPGYSWAICSLPNKEDVYLVFSNTHHGYYSHGYTATKANPWKSGSL